MKVHFLLAALVFIPALAASPEKHSDNLTPLAEALWKASGGG